MILVFGGTTEGRKAAKVLEQSGTPYYYSTRGSEQEVDLVHGLRLSGAMTAEEATGFCRDRDIRLLIDAGHPFAAELHRMVAEVAARLQLPVVRYDRIFPPRTPDITWCHDYADAIRRLQEADIRRLLMLTGVQTIERMKPYWQHHDTWCRILDRDSSRATAARSGFPEERLIGERNPAPQEGSGNTDTALATLIADLRPQAIITKESGLSGGFRQKVETARAAGIRVFAVERPHIEYPATLRLQLVNGPHGLRRAVERLLPDFYPLKSGLTTGTCATAAAVAALQRLQTGETPAEVAVRLPDGETIPVAVGYADGHAFCIKDAGDDPDVTHGAEVRATVEAADHFEVRGGEGVGHFTLPGFDYPPGEAAINRGPRQMLRENIPGNYVVTISVPQGTELAQRTFNPRLGIEGGISIIGVSGIVQPYSEEAFLESIRKCLEVAKASAAPRVVLGSGAKSEGALRNHYPALPAQAFVQYGNFVGDSLRMAAELGIGEVTLGLMLGKAVKLAAGQLDTHSRRGTFDRTFLCQLLEEAHCEVDCKAITLVRELWNMLSPEQSRAFVATVLAHCREHCRPLLPAGHLTILLIDEDGCIRE